MMGQQGFENVLLTLPFLALPVQPVMPFQFPAWIASSSDEQCPCSACKLQDLQPLQLRTSGSHWSYVQSWFAGRMAKAARSSYYGIEQISTTWHTVIVMWSKWCWVDKRQHYLILHKCSQIAYIPLEQQTTHLATRKTPTGMRAWVRVRLPSRTGWLRIMGNSHFTRYSRKFRSYCIRLSKIRGFCGMSLRFWW